MQAFMQLFTKTKTQKYSAITNQLNLCIDLIDQHKSDLDQIKIALNQSRQDTSLVSSVFSKSEQQTHITMLTELANLLDTYPIIQDEEHLNLDYLNQFHHERTQHHIKVMQFVEVYLPETYALLNQAANRIEGYK